jgi:hypothetical protein
MRVRILLEPFEIGDAIGVGKEHVLAPIATLGDVVGNSRVYGSGLP